MPTGTFFVPGRRILVAGTSGAGKSTLALQLSELLDLPYVELDALFHGPGWTPRPQFEAEVAAFSSGPAWVCEWQYRSVRQLLLQRADTLVWLDYSRSVVLGRVIRRTVRRRILNQELWNGNREPGLWHAFTHREGIVRWACDTHTPNRLRLAGIEAEPGHLQVIRQRTPSQTAGWLEMLRMNRNAAGSGKAGSV